MQRRLLRSDVYKMGMVAGVGWVARWKWGKGVVRVGVAMRCMGGMQWRKGRAVRRRGVSGRRVCVCRQRPRPGEEDGDVRDGRGRGSLGVGEVIERGYNHY